MKLVILDRDGVINHDSDDYIKSPDEWIPIPGSLEAIARLNHAGYTVTIATNQSGIARGYFDISTLNAMHEKMHRLVNQEGGHVDGIFFCPHAPTDNCNCRKPLPGLLLQISRRFSISMENAPFIGDSAKDIEAARLAGARPILVKTGKGERTLEKLDTVSGIPTYENLSEAVTALLQESAH